MRESKPEASVQLRCHYCQRFLGESSEPVIFAGLFKDVRDRVALGEPRSTYRCPGCKWANVFQSPPAEPPKWRSDIDLKRAS